MKLILENWWQFIIIIFVLTASVFFTGKSIEGTLREINSLLKTLSKEVFLTTKSRMAAIVNIVLGLLAGVIALVLATPSLLAQLGLTNDNNSAQAVIIFLLFVVTIIISLSYIGKFETQHSAFKDSGAKTERKKKLDDDNNINTDGQRKPKPRKKTKITTN